MKTRGLRRLVAGALMAALAYNPALVDPVPPPTDDPFYAQPASFDGTKPGQVLNSRPVTISGLGVPLPFTSWQVQYVTTNTVGEKQAAVATVIKPPLQSGEPKLVSYQTAIDSLSYLCDPSYKLRQGTLAEEVNIGVLLLRGWTVVVPDFLGPNHEWTAGYVEGQSTLDGIRAAENFAPSGLSGTATPVGLTGYSGGARGTEFAAELAPTYAPELNIVGAAPGGLAVNAGSVAKGANGNLFAGVYFAAAFGLARAYPEIDINSLLNEKGMQLKRDIAPMCIEEFTARYAFEKIETYTKGGVDPLTIPRIQKVIAETEAGQYGTPRVPIHLYQATFDELVVTPDADRLVKSYCAKGVTVQYVKYPLGHVTALPAGYPGAVDWLSDRFAGKPARATC